MTQEDSRVLDPSNWAKSQPKPPLLSSGSMEWSGLSMYRFRNPKKWHMELPPLSDHLIVVHLANPSPLALRLNGQWQRARSTPGSLAIMEAHQENAWEWEGGEIDELHICLDTKILDSASEELLGKTTRLANGINIQDPWIYQIGLQLLANVQSPSATTRLFGDLMAQSLSLQLLRNHSSDKKRDDLGRVKISRPRLQRALDYIESNLAADITIDDIAEAAAMSSFHFAHCFRQSMGTSPHQHLIKRRVERATEMLRHTREPISQIALSVGFPNQSHFTTVFKRLIGTTPLSYRMDSSV
ncbi:MAG TPA: AraC family transcriptional regulator [Burkholderiaceae bacterium]|nr:AraC family transcriptional regulator [Burkholderiaceae bacterium]